VSPLGAGGMGEVYRARDTQLKRDVAIKILPEGLTGDPDRVARFQREAELLATLNHTHIAQVYGLEKADAGIAIVLELVEGETLADVIVRGPVALDETLAIGRQIADALETAHDTGVIHRDLKPANIKITPDGKVKVLDFGLAKMMEGSGESSASGRPGGLSLSPTLSVHATYAGTILGTAAYMSPEQARGKPVDRRADIWAFGCVLFEMLTGRQPFPGESITDIVSAITRDEPAWSTLPAETPPHVRALLRRCLQKDPLKRLPHIGVARLEIDEGPAFAATAASAASMPTTSASKVRAAVPWAIACAALAMSVAALAIWAPWRATPTQAAIRLEATIGADAALVTDTGPAAVLSPDGTLLTFAAQNANLATSQLFVRHLDHLDAAVLAGTDGARSPFFSPDGQWIGFFAEGKLKKISISGGAPVTLCDATNGRGAHWGDDGMIVFQPANTGTGENRGATLLGVSSAGGEPKAVTSAHPEDESSQRWPQVLPGGRFVMYTAPRSAGNYVDANVNVQSLADHTRKTLVRGSYFARYVPSGHLLYMQQSTMFAAPFDLARLEVAGQAASVLEHVTVNTTVGTGHFSVSNTGTLVYLGGPDLGGSTPIAWLTRDGKTSAMQSTPSNWSNLSFSPDSRHLVMDIASQQIDIWVYDVDRDALQRLTFNGSNQMPIWTPDGRRVVYRNGNNLFWIRSDGGGAPERLATSASLQYPGSWHPSGKLLAYTEAHPQTNNDIMILPIDGDEASGWKPGTPTVFVNGTASESEPMFSPDGRWIAYSSAETGRNEIFVRPYPGPGGKWQISTGGGALPTWSRARKELFYLALPPDGRIIAVPYSISGDSFNADKPRPWSETRIAIRPRAIAGLFSGRTFDVTPDGERFAVAPAPVDQKKQDKVFVVFNFFDELRRLAPVRK
jgi:Tol biopolymer transport system component